MPDSNLDWPQLDWPSWQSTAATLHMFTQIVGKTRLGLSPLQNHWWNVALYVSARGLTTSPMPVPGRPGDVLEVEFDLLAHRLLLRLSTGTTLSLPLQSQSVASFFSAYRAALERLGIAVHIDPMPCELQTPVRFDLDTANNTYDLPAVERFHRALILIDTLFKRFSTGFQGKISPVHFFWGSFDLCVTRFSGRPASGPPKTDRVQREAYSHEVISAGFWPGNGGFGAPAFYCYAAPVPARLPQSTITPGAYNTELGEFIPLYDDARASADPAHTVMSFLESSYAAAAGCAGWDRSTLDRPIAAAPSA